MAICVIYPKVSAESAIELAQKMGWDAINPFAENKRDFRNYIGVFNYGCNRKIYAHNVVNKSKSVAVCIDKVATYEVLKKAGVPTVSYTTNKADVPKEWDIVVIRDKIDGHKAEGLDYFYQGPGWYDGNKPRHWDAVKGALFSEHFPHEYELRIVVFCGKVVGCYKKVDNAGQWDFVAWDGVEAVENDAITAAKALDIDYVGFDVLVNKKGAYIFLEANSGPILVDEVADAIAEYVK